jgi:hypothetical protein
MKVKSTDLRSGNYLSCFPLSIPRLGIHGADWFKITALGIHYIETGEMSAEALLLTGEWLMHFGFRAQYLKGMIYYSLGKNEETAVWIRERTGSSICKVRIACLDIPVRSIMYVHKFQNVYYDFRGKELKYIYRQPRDNS